MFETLKKAIFGDPKEKQRKELEKIIKAKLEPVEAYLVLNGTLWEHEFQRPYKRTLKDDFKALVFKIGTSWVLEIRNRKNPKFDTPRKAYAALIDKISGKGTFESNPFVFAYNFNLVK